MELSTIAMTVVSTAIASFVGYYVKKLTDRLEKAEKRRTDEIQKNIEEYTALRDGVRCMLRNQLLTSCSKYIACGAKPFYEINNIGSMYQAYHALGGNGGVTQLYERFNTLPIKGDKHHGNH